MNIYENCSTVQLGKYFEHFLLRMVWSKVIFYCHCFPSLL